MATMRIELKGRVHCAMCSREAVEIGVIPVVHQGAMRMQVMPGQRCSHCRASLDAGCVVELMPQAQNRSCLAGIACL